MAAGDLVVADWQVELRDTLMGDGTAARLDRHRGGIEGLFANVGKPAESEYAHAPGSFIGSNDLAARSAVVHLELLAATPAAVGALLVTQMAVWEPTGTAEEPLYFRLPGIGKRYVNGWPTGLIDVDISRQVFGQILIAGTFRVTDPTIHT